jgi:uncharacterized protein (DUF427 family)
VSIHTIVVRRRAGARADAREGGNLAASSKAVESRADMKRAEWNGEVLAESDDIVTVEGNAYFPEAALRREFFQPSETHTVCPWKGTASYYTVRVAGKENRDAAWYYPTPSDAARRITGRVAFWKGVVVRDA